MIAQSSAWGVCQDKEAKELEAYISTEHTLAQKNARFSRTHEN